MNFLRHSINSALCKDICKLWKKVNKNLTKDAANSINHEGTDYDKYQSLTLTFDVFSKSLQQINDEYHLDKINICLKNVRSALLNTLAIQRKKSKYDLRNGKALFLKDFVNEIHNPDNALEDCTNDFLDGVASINQVIRVCVEGERDENEAQPLDQVVKMPAEQLVEKCKNVSSKKSALALSASLVHKNLSEEMRDEEKLIRREKDENDVDTGRWIVPDNYVKKLFSSSADQPYIELYLTTQKAYNSAVKKSFRPIRIISLILILAIFAVGIWGSVKINGIATDMKLQEYSTKIVNEGNADFKTELIHGEVWICGIKDGTQKPVELIIPQYINYEGVQRKVVGIADDAFSARSLYGKITNVILPDTIEYIGKNAFGGCSIAPVKINPSGSSNIKEIVVVGYPNENNTLTAKYWKTHTPNVWVYNCLELGSLNENDFAHIGAKVNNNSEHTYKGYVRGIAADAGNQIAMLDIAEQKTAFYINNLNLAATVYYKTVTNSWNDVYGDLTQRKLIVNDGKTVLLEVENIAVTSATTHCDNCEWRSVVNAENKYHFEQCKKCGATKNYSSSNHSFDVFHMCACGSYNATEGIIYELSADGTYYIVKGMHAYSGDDICIADYYNGLPVRVVAANAFKNDTTLTRLTIPANVKSIESGAFEGCVNLCRVVITKNTTLSADAFKRCYRLVEIITDSTDIVLNTNPEKDVELDGNIAYYALNIRDFEYKKDNIQFANDCTFYIDGKNVYLMSMVNPVGGIVLPNSFKNEDYSIYDFAFFGCDELVSVVISRGVESIASRSFSGCGKLGEIIVDKANEEYYSENNCVIEIATNKLIVGCKNSIIPASVVAIGDYAFYGAGDIKFFELGDSIVSIGNYAFAQCSGLTSIMIPKSVMTIGKCAFVGCEKLNELIFMGDSFYTTPSYDLWLQHKGGTPISLKSSFANVDLFVKRYPENYWYRG